MSLLYIRRPKKKRFRECLPWACSVAKGSLSLIIESGGHMTQARTSLNGGDIRRIESYGVHAIQLDDKVAVFSAQPEGCVTVAARLRTDLDAGFSTARDGGLDMLDFGSGHDGNRRIRKPYVERRDILSPIVAPLRVDRDVGGAEAVIDRRGSHQAGGQEH